MKTGDIVRDDQGRAFQIGQILGRGLWGKTYAVREEHGPEWALTVPLSQSELPASASHLAKICREILLEQARLLTNNRLPFLPPIDSRITTDKGDPAILMPRQPLNLDRRLSGGCSTEDLLSLCLELSAAARELGQILPGGHGNLTPENVLLTEQDRVMLFDPLTPTARKHLSELRAAAGPRGRPGLAYVPPEQRAAGGAAGAVSDTYAIGMILYWGLLASGELPTRLPETPLSGLDKASLVALKDRVHNRLKEEGANPRFHTRLSDRTSAFLNRALSEKTAPSPPYRFLDIGEFHSRLEHLKALVNPAVEHVGKILLDRPPGSDSYTTDEDVVFSCTIGCSPGVETHEEIACGLAVFDREKDERIRDLGCAYTVDSHPSGRLRFGFRLSELAPGSYAVRVAFKIRESSSDPLVAEGRFERRAAPGYIPPRTRPTRRPIPMERPEPDPITQTRTNPGLGGPGLDGPGLDGPGSAPRQPGLAVAMPPRTSPGLDGPGLDGPGLDGPGLDGPGSAPRQPPGVAVAPSRATIKSTPPPVRQPPPRTSRPVTSPGVAAVQAVAAVPAGHDPLRTPPGQTLTPDPDLAPEPPRVKPIIIPEHGAGQSSDAFDDTPLYSNAGDWSPDIPIVNDPLEGDGDDLYENEFDGPELSTEDSGELVGPIGLAMERFFEVLRGDAYVMFIGGAAVIMILLLLLLFALG